MRKTKRERRLEVLKDVQKQLRLESFIANRGEYVVLPFTLRQQASKETHNALLEKSDGQTCLLESTEPCRVCAKGALFLSLVRKENNVRLVDLEVPRVRIEKTRSLFGKANLDLMEAAFECWYYYTKPVKDSFYGTKWNSEDGVCNGKVKAFCEKYPDTGKRLEAIVRNAIKNNGIFKLK